MEEKRIIGLLGTIGSGKTYVSDYLVKNYGFYKISMGDLIREKTIKLGIERTRENLIKVANEYREKYGADYWINEVFKKVKNSMNKNILIDGVRTPIEAETAKKNKAILIFIDAKPILRYKRLIKRAREGEAKKTFRETLKYINYKLLNNSTKENLENNIESLLKKII